MVLTFAPYESTARPTSHAQMVLSNYSQTSPWTRLTAAPVSIMNCILTLEVSPTTKYEWVGFTADNFIALSSHTLLSVTVELKWVCSL